MKGRQHAAGVSVIKRTIHFGLIRGRLVDGVDESDASVQCAKRSQDLVRLGRAPSQIPLIDWEYLADGHLIVEGAVPLEELVARVGKQHGAARLFIFFRNGDAGYGQIRGEQSARRRT